MEQEIFTHMSSGVTKPRILKESESASVSGQSDLSLHYLHGDYIVGTHR